MKTEDASGLGGRGMSPLTLNSCCRGCVRDREMFQFMESESEETVSRSVVSHSATPWTVARQALLFVGFSRQDTGVRCHALGQGIFPTQAPNPGLPQCRRILSHLSHQAPLHGSRPQIRGVQIPDLVSGQRHTSICDFSLIGLLLGSVHIC